MRNIINPAVRTWLYGILIAAVPLLVAYGAIDDQKAPLFIAAGAAVLGQGLAALHVPTGATAEALSKKTTEADEEPAQDTPAADVAGADPSDPAYAAGTTAPDVSTFEVPEHADQQVTTA